MSLKTCVIFIIALLLALPAAAQAQVAGYGSAEAVAYVRERQNEDGGFCEPGASSDLRTTCWAVMAAVAAGEEPLSWTRSGDNPATYINSNVATTSALRDFELVALALASAGGNPRAVAGRDLIALIKASTAADGKIGADIEEHCWGVIALAASGETVPPASMEWLIGQQRADGGWGESDKVIVQDTALAVEALIAAEEDVRDSIDSALELLRERMNADGGFSGVAKGSDAQATSTVIRALNAAGEDPSSEDWAFQGNNSSGYLESLQAGDGHFQFSKGVESQPVMTTSMATPAVEGEYFPLASSLDVVTEEQSGTDLGPGTVGAGLSSLESSQVGPGGVSVKVAQGPASGATGTAGGALGFWLFLVACGAYAMLLLMVAAVLSMLSRRKTPGTGFP